MNWFKVSEWSPRRKFLTFGLMILLVIGFVISQFDPDETKRVTLFETFWVLGFVFLGGASLGRDQNTGGDWDTSFDNVDREIALLQRRLQSSMRMLANAERRGDAALSADLRGDVAVLESKLRRLGA